MAKTSEIGIGLIALLTVVFLIDDVLPYLELNEASYGRFWDRSGWLLSHVIGGSLESWTFGVVLFIGGVFWLATTSKAVLAAVRRHIAHHREWMIRSYIFTFSFVSFRLLLEIPWIENLGTDAEVSTTIG